MFNFYKKCFVFVVLILFLLKVFSSFVVQDELFHYTHKRVFDDKEKFDFIYLGNSLSQRSYDNSYIDDELNTKSINIGSAAQYFYITNEIFNELVEKKEIHPNKLLVVTISPYQFNRSESETWKFLQMAALDEIDYSWNSLKIINKLYGIEEYPKVISPLIRFHGELSENIIETNDKLNIFKRTNATGFVLNATEKLDKKEINQRRELKTLANSYGYNVDNTKEIPFNEEDKNLILNMIKKSSENNIKLLFVTPPSIEMIYAKEEYGKMKYLERFFNDEQVNYINLNKNFTQLNLDYDDYTDYSHLNKFGIKKLSPFLLSYMLEEMNIIKNSKTTLKIKEREHVIDEQLALEEIKLPKITNWSKSTLDLKETKLFLDKEKVYSLSRKSITKPSYIASKNIDIDSNKIYRASIRVKKGEKSSFFGFRIQGVYPHRIDAVFDLENGKIEGVTKTGNFDSEKASIKQLEGDWYICSITGRLRSNDIVLIFGPTTDLMPVLGWESPTHDDSDVMIIPSSLKFFKK